MLGCAALAAFLLFRPDTPVRPRAEEPAPAGIDPSAASREPAAAVPLPVLLDRFLNDRGVRPAPGGNGGGLARVVPPGRSLLAVHAEIARAVGLWGGRISDAREIRRSGGAAEVEILLVAGSERARLRLVPGTPPPGGPVVAVVLDDLGHQTAARLSEFLQIPIPFTPAILPGYPRSIQAVGVARAAGRLPLLHLPLDPLDAERHDPGPGAVRSGMGAAEIRGLVKKHLLEMEGIVGVSHHMGSRGSADPRVVGPVLEIVGEHGLFYLDSGTSAESVVPALAARAGVRCPTADRFLDRDPAALTEEIRDAFRAGCGLARENGSAILICHPRPATLQALRDFPEIARREGCRMVPLDQLLD